MFAIVDIETTGGHAASNGITEIAIGLHDGEQLVDFYESLVNPQQPIPYFIQKLTGITSEMVQHAPTFEQIAPTVYAWLANHVFVAHNVNFDFSFVKHQLAQAGFQLNTKKLCTIRAARKILPGLPAYGLGKISQTLEIVHSNKHRAGGDVKATSALFSILRAKDVDGHISRMIYGKNEEQYLPPNLSADDLINLPQSPGVYYFHNKKEQIIYVGKAINLRKRVQSHFSNNKTNKTKQLFLREIKKITFETHATDLMASIKESAEIRTRWPRYNRSQRGYQAIFGLVQYEDRAGKNRLAVERIKLHTPSIYRFNTLQEGHKMLIDLMVKFELCPVALNLCDPHCCSAYYESPCSSICCCHNIPAHNEKMNEAINSIHDMLPTFAFLDKGRNAQEQSFVLIKKGQVSGIGYLPAEMEIPTLSLLEKEMQNLAGNDYMRNLVYKQAQFQPESVVNL